MPGSGANTNSNETEAGKLVQLLELELEQKRADWKKASARHRTVRTMSFVLIFMLIVACMLGLFFVFSRVNEERANQSEITTPAARP